MEPKSSVQPCKTITPIYFLYGLQCAGGLHQGNAFGCSNGILQLSTNLRILFICFMNLESRQYLTFTSSNAGKHSKEQDTWKKAGYIRALPNDIRAPDMAPLIPPVSEVSMILSRHRMLLFRKFSLVPEYMVKLAAPEIRTFSLDVRKVRAHTHGQKIWSLKVSTTLDRIPLSLLRDKQVRQASG